MFCWGVKLDGETHRHNRMLIVFLTYPLSAPVSCTCYSRICLKLPIHPLCLYP
jgi:hypothetical protein